MIDRLKGAGIQFINSDLFQVGIHGIGSKQIDKLNMTDKLSTAAKWTLAGLEAATVVGLAAACKESVVLPTNTTDQGTSTNTSEITQTPENNAHKAEFFWKSDKIAETAQNAGVPVENVSGYQIVIDGAATADGKLKIDFNNFLDEKTNTVRSVYYSFLYEKNVNETFITTKTVDGQEIAQKQYYTSSGEVKTILEYPANSSARLVAGETITATVFPDDIQSAMIPSYDGNGIKVLVNPNPEWQQINNPNIYDQSFDFKVLNVDNPVATGTPTEAPVEAKSYEICETENWRACKLTKEDLNGPYQEWYMANVSEPFDPSKIQGDLPLANYGPDIFYPSNTAPHFTGENEGTEPFRRDKTIGYIEYQDSEGREWLALIMPLELFDPNNPTVNQLVITAHSFPMWWHKYTDKEINNGLKVWKEDMSVTPILTDTLDLYSKTEDPLVADSFKKYPDMQDRFNRLVGNNSYDVSKQDMSALSAPGIIVHNNIEKVISGKNPYK